MFDNQVSVSDENEKKYEENVKKYEGNTKKKLQIFTSMDKMVESLKVYENFQMKGLKIDQEESSFLEEKKSENPNSFVMNLANFDKEKNIQTLSNLVSNLR